MSNEGIMGKETEGEVLRSNGGKRRWGGGGGEGRGGGGGGVGGM